MEDNKGLGLDKFFLAFMAACLVAYLGSCVYQVVVNPASAPAVMADVKDTMQWFGLPLGVGAAAIAAVKK